MSSAYQCDNCKLLKIGFPVKVYTHPRKVHDKFDALKGQEYDFCKPCHEQLIKKLNKKG